MLLLPLFLLSFARAARRGARGADVVHAHWLPSAVAGLATRKPLVLQAWGSDVELAKRLPWLFRPLLRRARVVVCASTALAADSRALGARDVRVIPSGVDIPDEVGDARGAAARPLRRAGSRRRRAFATSPRRPQGLPLVVVGDGPLRDLVPSAVGFVPARRARPLLRARRGRVRAVAARGLRRRRPRGDGLRQAVVSTGVGGLADAIDDGVTGLVVPPGDVAALRAALEQLLGDAGLRRRLGSGRAREGAGDLLVAGGHGGDDRRLSGRDRLEASGACSARACAAP